ncbi:MAG: hypothetical protein HKO57_13275, partial [Akkermansiaceae bacterium]|nr:hypothetical protein [Akkermansiaceae bacterium]
MVSSRASACSMLAALIVLAVAAGCASIPGGVGRRASLAKAILNNPRISLMSYHVSGRRDSATALHNIQHTARGGA